MIFTRGGKFKKKTEKKIKKKQKTKTKLRTCQLWIRRERQVRFRLTGVYSVFPRIGRTADTADFK